jgi:hypothetical protein
MPLTLGQLEISYRSLRYKKRVNKLIVKILILADDLTLFVSIQGAGLVEKDDDGISLVGHSNRDILQHHSQKNFV